jgi:predicted nucleic acid-binding protein
MTTAIDTNVLVALWDVDPELNAASERALDSAQERGALAVSGAVYAELLALPGRTKKMLDAFFHATAIPVDWEAGEQIWRVAGRAFQSYVGRRKRSKEELPRRILADFFIGAHAALDRYRLMTLDQRLYRAAFPKLEILTF